MTRILFCQSNRYFNTFLWLILAALMTPLAARAEWQIVITTPDKGHYTHPVIQSYEGESWDESVTYDMEYPMGSAGSYFFQNWPSLNPFEGKIDINVSLTAKLIWAGGGDQSSSSSSSSFSAPPRVIYIKETLSASAGSQGPTYKRGPSGEPDDAVETPLIPSMTAELGSADGFQVSRVDDSEGDSQSKTVTGTKITRYEVPEEPNANGNWEITIARSPHAMVSATGWRQGYMSCGVGWSVEVDTFSISSNIETSFTKGYPTNGGSWGFIPVEIKNPADNKTLVQPPKSYC